MRHAPNCIGQRRVAVESYGRRDHTLAQSGKTVMERRKLDWIRKAAVKPNLRDTPRKPLLMRRGRAPAGQLILDTRNDAFAVVVTNTNDFSPVVHETA